MKIIEPRVFRATAEAWFGQFLLPVVFFGMLTITAVNQSGLNPAVASLGLGILLMIAISDYLLPMTRNWAMLDARMFEASVDGRLFRVYWTEVNAVWMVREQGRRYLCLGTSRGSLVLPLRFLDEQGLWRLVQELAPAEALDLRTAGSLPAGHMPQRHTNRDGAEVPQPKTVADHWLIQVIGWGGLAFCLFLLLNTLHAGEYLSALILGLVVIFCVLVLAHWGINEIGPETITRSTLLSGGSMAWSEVRRIEVDPLGSVIVLFAETHRLVISGPGLWSGSGRAEAFISFAAQAERRSIPLQRTFRALVYVYGTRGIPDENKE